MRVLDLFSGIGGISLGLERAGMRTVAFAEIDPFCRRVLAMHWPGVPIYDDVRTVTADRLRADGVAADVVCGGFPCQDISLAGKGAGIAGERSGLWVEFARIIGEVRPRFAIVENVAALTARGLRTVLGDLAEIGYDAEWHCIPASAVGAPHRRDRIWIIAYPDADGQRQPRERQPRERQPEHCVIEGASGREPDGLCPGGRRDGPAVADAGGARLPAPELAPVLGARRWNEGRAAAERGWWRAEPAVGRVADGVPHRVHRVRSLGNAVVPQIPEIIGRAIMSQQGEL